MAGKIKWLYALAAVVILCQVIDGITTYLVLSGENGMQDDNPVARQVFESIGLPMGLTTIKVISMVAALYVLFRVKKDRPRSVIMSLVCLSICSALMIFAVGSNIFSVMLYYSEGLLPHLNATVYNYVF
jgi:uncharacterized membrane protein